MKDVLAQVEVAEGSLSSFSPEELLAPEVPDNEPPAWSDAASAWFMNESWMGAGLETINDPRGFEDDPDFVAIRHLRENEDDYADVMDVGYSGDFENVRSVEELEAQVYDIRKERERRSLIDNSTIAQTIVLGGMTGLTEVVAPGSLIGAGMRRGALWGATALGGSAAFGTATTETILHGTQHERTLSESILNTAAAGTIGGVVGGVLSKLATRSSLAERVDLGLEEERPVVIPSGVESMNRSVGAAEVDKSANTYAQRTVGMRAVDAIMDLTPLGRTPSVVAARSQLDETRDFFNRLADTGILTEAQEKGQARVGVSAEELREFYQGKAVAVQSDYNRVFQDLNVAKGDNAVALNLRAEFNSNRLTRVTQEQFDREVYMSMVVEDYVPDDPIMADHVKRGADIQRRFYKDFWDEGVRLGVFSGSSNYKDLYVPQLWNRAKIAENPSEFRQWMMENFEQRFDEGWLQERKGLSLEDYDGLTPPERQAIRDEFNRENDIWAMDKAESAYDAAVEAERVARADLVSASREARKSNTRQSRAVIRAAAADAKFLEGRRNLVMQEAAAEKADADTLIRAGDTLRRAELARQEALIQEPRFNESQFSVFEGRQRAAADLDEIMGSQSPDRREVAKRLRAYEKWEQEWVRVSDTGTVTATDTRFRSHVSDPRYNYLKGQADRASRQARVLTKRAKQLEGRYFDLTERMLSARYAEKATKVARKAMKDAQERASKTHKLAVSDLKRAKREYETATKGAVSTREMVDGIIENLTDAERFPSGILYDGAMAQTTAKTGRAKHRGLKINDNPDLMRKLLDSGYLRSNMGELSERYARDLGGRFGLREKFGTDDALEISRQLKNTYDERVEALQSAGRTKEASALLDEWKDVSKSLEMMTQKELGKWDVNNSFSMGEHIGWFGRMARMANTLRYMGSATVSSVTDIAIGSLQQSPAKQLTKAFGSNVSKTIKELKDQEMAAFLFAAENNPGMSRAMSLYSVDDMVYDHGMGKGLTRKVTAGMEQGTMKLTEKMFTLNLMREWNGRLSYAAGHSALMNIMELAGKVSKGGKLTDKEMRDMAFAGFDEVDMRQFAKLNEAHNFDIANGVKFPDTAAWRQTKEGAEAARRLMLGLNRVSKRAVIRVGTADLPPFVSSGLGKLIFQFQSFGYASVNKWMRNLDVKARNGEMAKMLGSVMWALALGTTAYVAREGVIKGNWGEVQEKINTPAGLLYEAVDRGGMMFILNPYFNALGKFATARGVPADEWGLVASRFGERTPMSSLVGPTYGLFEELQMLATETEGEKAMDRLGRLTPYRNLWWLDAIMANGFGQPQ